MSYPLFVKKLFFGRKIRIDTWNLIVDFLKYKHDVADALNALAIITSKRHNKVLESIYNDVLNSIRSGQDISISFAPYISYDEFSLIDGAEKRGDISKGMKDAIKIIEAKNKIIGAFFSSLTYPVILFCFVIAALFVYIKIAIPALYSFNPSGEWDGPVGFMVALSNFLISPAGLFFIVAIILIISMSIISLPYLTGPIRVRLDKIFIYKIYKMLVGSSWLFSMAILMNNSKSTTEDILDNMLKSKYITRYMKYIISIIKREKIGKSLATAIYNSKLDFPSGELVDRIGLHANLPNFEKIFPMIASDFIDISIIKLKKTMRIINFLCISLAGGVTIMLVYSIFAITDYVDRGAGNMIF